MPEIPNFPNLCKSLAVEMTARTGELWRLIEHGESWPHIESPSACLSLRDDWQTHRLVIHATAPHGMREKTNGESITCNPKRTPEEIARDIENRLLAHARAHLKVSKEWDADRKREDNKKKLRAKMIKKYCPKEYQDDKFCTVTGSRNGYVSRVYAHPTYDDLINIEVNLPLPEALKLLEQLTKGE